MKKIVLFVLFVSLSVSSSLFGDEKKSYTFLGNEGVTPYIYNSDTKAEGLIVDLFEAISKEANIKTDIQALNWKLAQNLVYNDDADGLLHINPNPQRLKTYIFSDNLIKSEFTIFKKTENLHIKDIKSLFGKTVGVEAKGYPKYLLEKYPNVNIKIINSWKEGFELVNQNKIDAVLVDKLVGIYTLSKNKISGISYEETPVEVSYSQIAVKKENKELLEKINLGIQKITQNGTKDKIINKWFREKILLLALEDLKKTSLNSSLNTSQNKLLLTNKEKEFLQNKTFNVCSRYNHYPLAGHKDGKLTGIAGDVFDRLASFLQIDFNVVAINSGTELEENVKANNCDLVSIMNKNFQGYENITTANTTLVYQKFVAIGNVDTPHIEITNQNDDITLYTLKTIVQKTFKKEYPNLKVEFVKSEKEIMEKLKENNKSFYVLPSLLANNVIENYGFYKYKIVSHFDNLKIQGTIGVNTQTNPELLTIINKGLENIGRKTINDIVSSYQIKEFKVKDDYSWLWYVLAVSVLGLVLLQYRYTKLLIEKNKQDIKLKEQNARYKLAIDANEDGLWDWDTKTNVVFISPSWKKMLGYNDNEITNNYFEWESRVHQDDLDNALANLQAHLDGKTDHYESKHRMKCKDGTYLWVEDKGKALFHKDGKPLRVIGYQRDITKDIKAQEEKEKYEAMLIQNSRLAQLSEMVSMIAHQWRQPLNALSIWNQNLFLGVEEGKLSKDELKMIKGKVNEIIITLSDTIDDFKDFYATKKEKNLFDLYKVVDKTLKIIDHDINLLRIDVIRDIPKNISMNSYENELSQVLMSIVNNSIDVFKEKKQSLCKINIEVQSIDDAVYISIEDNAGGIPKDILPKIFDPYFSTKQDLNGTGLGLYMSKMIIEKSFNGSIEAINTTEGAKFVLKLKNEA